jgi:hypothetical protein
MVKGAVTPNAQVENSLIAYVVILVWGWPELCTRTVRDRM